MPGTILKAPASAGWGFFFAVFQGR